MVKFQRQSEIMHPQLEIKRNAVNIKRAVKKSEKSKRLKWNDAKKQIATWK